MLRFPDGFLWGTATSAYQIEGAGAEDGRGESIWDRFAARPGAIADGSDGAVACDHYHRWRRDLELMKWLGLGAYRFSVAWPRIFPTGRWQVNRAGLEFYDRLTDGLLEAGIEPFVTLYHWDLPQPLEDAGGWAVRSTVDAFVEYVDVVSDLLGDRVRRFITHNEPWCTSVLGYGRRACTRPGKKRLAGRARRRAHHLSLLVARPRHRRSSAATPLTTPRSASRSTWCPPSRPPRAPPIADACRAASTAPSTAGSSIRSTAAATRRTSSPTTSAPATVASPELELPFVHAGDLATIAAKTDFLGVNYYSRAVVRSDRVAEADNAPRIVHTERRAHQPSAGRSTPTGCASCSCACSATTRLPAVYITENGAAYDTAPDEHGRVHDIERQRFLRVARCRPRCEAIEDGRTAARLLRCVVAARQLTSGRRAIASASASSGSTSPPRRRVPSRTVGGAVPRHHRRDRDPRRRAPSGAPPATRIPFRR